MAKVIILLVVALAITLCAGRKITLLGDESPILSKSLVEEINSKQNSWVASMNSRFDGVSKRDFKKLLGVKNYKGHVVVGDEVSKTQAIPTSFDSRTQWANCIGPVLDQGHCGSCWAFGAVESLQDRACIQGGAGAKIVPLSEQYLVSCDSSDGGCDGGEPASAWDFLKSKGTVTEECYPYAMGNCTHPGCSEWPTPSCKRTCADGSSFKSNLHFAASAYSIASNPNAIATEIMTHGPIEVTMAVYEDFAHYSSGVYVHTSGSLLGYHAIKNIGWGVENNTEYWLIQNSWNAGWGEAGYFKIRRGTDEVGIESGCVAGLAKV